MIPKRQRVTELAEELGLDGSDLFQCYCACFDAGRFYDAHDALEQLWLPCRREAIGAFYQGLIQLAGAFVHCQRHSDRHPRIQPAAALLRLARSNLAPFGPHRHGLDVGALLRAIDQWLAHLESPGAALPLNPPPQLPRAPKCRGEV